MCLLIETITEQEFCLTNSVLCGAMASKYEQEQWYFHGNGTLTGTDTGKGINGF